MAYERGIDVSHWQGDIDWQKVKAAGIQFAVVKATEGNTYVDNKFQLNWKGLTDIEIIKAAYHYLRGQYSADSQVALIKGTLTADIFNAEKDIIVIDVEKNRNENISPGQIADNLNGVIIGLKDTYKNIYIYTGPYYWENEVDWKKYDFSIYNLWIAHYTNGSPTIPTTWQNHGYTWWQYSNKGTVSGIQGPVDLDRTK